MQRTNLTAVVAIGLSVAISLPATGQMRARTTVTRAGGQTITSATIDRSRIDRVLGGPDTALRVVRPSGATTVPQAADSVRIKPGEFIFRKTSSSAIKLNRAATAAVNVSATDSAVHTDSVGETTDPTIITHSPNTTTAVATLSGEAYAMPYRWFTVDSLGVEHVLVPYFIVVGGGLEYHAASRTYRGIALVGVEDTLHPTSGPMPFPQPLRMQLTTTSGGTVSRFQLALTHTGLDYDSVTIEAPGATTVRVRTSTDQQGVLIPIPIRAMTVKMNPRQKAIQAFGLATTDIAVNLPRGFRRTDTTSITVSGTSSSPRPGTLELVGTTPSFVTIRSGMPGQDTITAYVDGEPAGETIVTFKPPWIFLSALLGGLLLGGLARFTGGKRLKKLKYLLRDLVRGAPFGVIVALGAALGLDWFGIKLDDPG